MEPVRLGFVGLGYWGTRLARAATRVDGVVVAGGFAPSEGRRIEFAEEFGCPTFRSLEALLATDVEGVLIATPINTHAEIAIAAAEAGKHVFVEKPLTVDVATAADAVVASEAAGVVMQVGHQRRRLAATRQVHEMARSGELGLVHSMEATIFNADALKQLDNWKFDPRQRVLGAMTQQGVHMIDNMQVVAGAARRVSVFASRVWPASRTVDTVSFMIEYDRGALGVISNSAIGAWVATFAVHGSSGSAWSEEDGRRFYRQGIDEDVRTEFPVEPVDAVAEEIAAFRDSIRLGRVPEVDGRAAIEVVAVLQAGALSADRGVPVEVDELRDIAKHRGVD